MIFGALAEIICINGNEGAAHSRDEVEQMLTKAWEDNGTWAIALAAGNADEPMSVVATIDASGEITWEPEPANERR